MRANDDPRPSAAKESFHQWTFAIPTLIVIVGLGSFAGFGVFHTVFRHRCLAGVYSNSTFDTLQQKLMTSMVDHKRCLDDDSHLEELHILRGRLASQLDIISRLSKELEGRPKVEELQNQIQQITDDLSFVRSGAEAAKIEKLELERALESERELTARIVQENEDDVAWILRNHAADSSAIESSMKSLQESQDEIVNHTRQRQGVMCRQLFGKGPYYVKFSVKLPGQQEDRLEDPFFVVEIASRKQLPHSSFTFLSLVESTFYDGSSFDSAANGVLRSGMSLSLEQRLKSLGFADGSALSFPEESPTFPCNPFSLGFVDRGPGLHLGLSQSVENDAYSQQTCFGTVVRGREWLDAIQSSLLSNEQPIEIVRVEHLRLNDEESWAHSSSGGDL